MGEGREGDWECGSCTNRNYAFRSFCNRSLHSLHVGGQTLCQAETPSAHKLESATQNSISSAQVLLLTRNLASAHSLMSIPYYFAYISYITCVEKEDKEVVKCGTEIISGLDREGTTSSMVNTNFVKNVSKSWDKVISIEEFCGEWENKRLNHERYKQSFSGIQINRPSYRGYEHIGHPAMIDIWTLPIPQNGSSITPWNSQGQVRLPRLTRCLHFLEKEQSNGVMEIGCAQTAATTTMHHGRSAIGMCPFFSICPLGLYN
ncbi:hypothetical protein IFM89_004045 [Coptis chinensis]|uniref:RanBP2-type domain-containing protein n=1 Tax=Coptis chinensis TaxID=261450 RepID=A0A835LCM2_9MAGN|nr:hypothetical protein IFM89_004045 [Coptis chinensis]